MSPWNGGFPASAPKPCSPWNGGFPASTPRGKRQFNPLVFEASYRDNKDSVGASVGIVPDCCKHHLK